jgi:hypothetical protein
VAAMLQAMAALAGVTVMDSMVHLVSSAAAADASALWWLLWLFWLLWMFLLLWLISL